MKRNGGSGGSASNSQLVRCVPAETTATKPKPKNRLRGESESGLHALR